LANAPIHALLIRRARELGKPLTALAEEAGLARSYLYKLANGVTRDPSIGTLVRLAQAMQISPVLLFRHFAQLHTGQSNNVMGPATQASGLRDPADAIAFSADVSIPDYSVVSAGEVFTKTWELQNTGFVPWRGRRLVRVDDQYTITRRHRDGSLEPVLESHLSSLQREVDVPETLPGQPVRISVDFAAPHDSCSTASIWRIENSAGDLCYPHRFFLQVIATVIDD
jgi:transcriptional regulator with XRE-family HTH domain